MRVACVQLCTGEDYGRNCSEILKYINQAIKIKSDLIITPEASTILTRDKKKLKLFTFKMSEDPFLKKVKIIAKKNKKWILLGSMFIKERSRLKNRSIVINPKGKIEAYYDKINMFDVKLSKREIHNESKTFKPGTQLKSVNTPWGKLGLTICYDIRFPELYRMLSKRKLKFITVPAAFTKMTGKKHWLTLLKARAIENFCYIFAPAQSGKNTNYRETFGHSAIISPDGVVLKLKKKSPGLIYSDIHPNLSLELRKKIPSLFKGNI